MPELVPISEGPTHRFAGLGNVVIAFYTGAPPASALRERVPWVERAIVSHGAFGQIVIVGGRAKGSLPGRAFRDESRAQTERYRGSILFSASVIEGEGVHPVLVRTFLRGLALVAAKDVPVRFFEDVRPAVAWAAERARDHGGPSAAELAEAIEALRAIESAPRG